MHEVEAHMAHTMDVERRYRADLVAIVAGVSAIGMAVGDSGILPGRVNDTDGASLAAAVGGLCCILGLLLAQRTPAAGRAVVTLGGVALLAAPFFFGRPVAWVWMLQVLLGVAVLAAAALLGRTPVDPPPDERRRTRSLSAAQMRREGARE